MTMTPTPAPERGPLAALRRFARPRPAVERCELCSLTLPPEHPHLLELANRRITCSCDACAVLFAGQEGAHFRRIPRQGQLLASFELPDALWDHLHVPIKLAFLFRNSSVDRAVALYPSPAGAVEATLPQETWAELLARNPVLGELEPDVEALLVNRVGERRDCYRAPIDECFRLVGLIRTHWRGLSGGVEVWEAIERFFARLGGGRS
jgi:hypothetical protein